MTFPSEIKRYPHSSERARYSQRKAGQKGDSYKTLDKVHRTFVATEVYNYNGPLISLGQGCSGFTLFTNEFAKLPDQRYLRIFNMLKEFHLCRIRGCAF